MTTLEEALRQLNYWKGAHERERLAHAATIEETNRVIAALTRELKSANVLASDWKAKYDRLAGGVERK